MFTVYYVLGLAERLALIRQQRAEAAKKRDEEKAGKLLRFPQWLVFLYFSCTCDHELITGDLLCFSLSQRTEEDWSSQMIMMDWQFSSN